MHVSSAGIITWVPTKLKVYKFTINVEDPCGLNTSKEFVVDVRRCPCEGQNGGFCKWSNPVQPKNGVTCICPDGCFGERFAFYISNV